MSALPAPQPGPFEEIPRELRERDQWVRWRLAPRPGSAKPTKQPLRSRGGALASSTDPATWATFAEALASPHGHGIGFVFSGDDPYVGIDLDGCLDPETGQLAAWAARIVTLLDSYTEISPSGRGVHIFVCGVIPGPRRRVGPVEMYSSGRYFTVTGRRLPGTRAEIAERTAELATIYSETFGSGLADEEGPRVISSSLSDDDLVRRAGEASNGEKFRSLWSGDTTGYLSHSEADLALCGILVHWTGRDPNRIDALFRSSGLMRRKWDERRGGATYGEMTIDRALHRADGGQRSRVGFPLTQYGNAERLVAHHGRDLRYLPALRQWLVWDGTRWRPDETGEIVRRAKDTVRRIYEEAGAEPDDDARKALARWAQRSEAESAIKAMIGLAESEPGVSVTANALDADCWALNVANGTLDLRTGVLRPHRREDLITKLAPVAYDAGARSERWETFLQRVLPDAELRAFVQRAAGYSLAGAPTEEVLLFVHGPSRTGKSTFIEALRSAFGDYAVVADFEAFVKRRNVGGPRNDVARLAGARLVVSIEVEDGQQLATALVKGLTGGDRITARYLYKEAFEFTPQFTLWIAANHRPRIPDDDAAMWERIRELPFVEVIPTEERDSGLKRELADPTLSGAAVLAWAVQGCLAWQASGLAPPSVVVAATEDFRTQMDPLAAFVADVCVLAPGAWTSSRGLREEYERYCRERGEQPVTGRELPERLKARGLESKSRGHKNARGWQGIGLRTERNASGASPASGTSDKSLYEGGISSKLPDQSLAADRTAHFESESATGSARTDGGTSASSDADPAVGRPVSAATCSRCGGPTHPSRPVCLKCQVAEPEALP